MQAHLDDLLRNTSCESGFIVSRDLLDIDKKQIISVLRILNNDRHKINSYDELIMIRGNKIRTMAMKRLKDDDLDNHDLYYICHNIQKKLLGLTEYNVRVLMAFLKDETVVFAVIKMSDKIMLVTKLNKYCYNCEVKTSKQCSKCGIYICSNI